LPHERRVPNPFSTVDDACAQQGLVRVAARLYKLVQPSCTRVEAEAGACRGHGGEEFKMHQAWSSCKELQLTHLQSVAPLVNEYLDTIDARAADDQLSRKHLQSCT
jgi:hypothetical protein